MRGTVRMRIWLLVFTNHSWWSRISIIQALDLDWLATEKGLARGDHSTGRQGQKTKEEQETHVIAFWPFNSTEVPAASRKEQSRAKSKRRIVEMFIGL